MRVAGALISTAESQTPEGDGSRNPILGAGKLLVGRAILRQDMRGESSSQST